MDVEFACSDLDRLDYDPTYDHDQAREVVSSYRKRLQGIRCALDTRDLLALAAWRVAALDRDNADWFLVPLVRSTRLVVEIPEGNAGTYVRVVRIEMNT